MQALLTIVLLTVRTMYFQCEVDGVRIDVGIESQIWAWTITNLTRGAITGVELDQHHTYNQQVPEGWGWEYDDEVVRMWAEDSGAAIRPGQSKTFTARLSSSGGVLGLVPARVEFAGGEEAVVFEEIWGPVPQQRHIIFLIPTVIIVIVLLHAWMLVRGACKKHGGSIA